MMVLSQFVHLYVSCYKLKLNFYLVCLVIAPNTFPLDSPIIFPVYIYIYNHYRRLSAYT